MTKTCNDCRQDLPLDSFYVKRDKGKEGSRPAHRCKSCYSTWNKQRHAGRSEEFLKHKAELQREADLRRQFGMGRADYDQMVDIQGGLCACCKLAPQGKGAAAVLNVDHDHVTGRVRGLLCNPCNQAMGLMKDNPAMVRQLLAYADYAAAIRLVA